MSSWIHAQKILSQCMQFYGGLNRNMIGSYDGWDKEYQSNFGFNFGAAYNIHFSKAYSLGVGLGFLSEKVTETMFDNIETNEKLSFNYPEIRFINEFSTGTGLAFDLGTYYKIPVFPIKHQGKMHKNDADFSDAMALIFGTSYYFKFGLFAYFNFSPCLTFNQAVYFNGESEIVDEDYGFARFNSFHFGVGYRIPTKYKLKK
ncbi:MAG: hypothetical protein C0594_06085 [Marinilabiliales bacterium]|nr:MAG: hypothetical protein C0594_06085 [Marinilabiliales bacterium]